MMARVWIVVLAVVAARVAGDREDGIMAAAIALAAFTVYLAMTLVIRSAGEERRPPMMSRLTTKQKVFLGLGLYILGVIVIVAADRLEPRRQHEFQPQNEFKLDTWVNLGLFSINKAVMYLVIAGDR